MGFAFADPGANRVVGALVHAIPLVLLAAILVPILLGIARRPQHGILWLAALVPYYGLLIIAPYRPPFAYGWKEGLAIYTLFWSLQSTPRRKRVAHPFPKVVQPILVYVGLGLIWMLFLHNTQGIVGFKVDYFWILLGVIVWRTPLDAKDRDRLISILMVDALITSALGLAQQVVGHVYLVGLGYSYNTNIRFTGSFLRSFSTMDNPFNFAFYLAFVMLIVLPQCLDDLGRLRNRLFLILSPVVIAALIFTFVRGAWLALAVGCAYLAIRRYRIFFLIAPFALIALLFVPGNFSESAFASGSLVDRQLGWTQNINKAAAVPMGHGIGTTGASGFKVQEVAQTSATVYEPDNQYFKALYEIGVFGLWFLVLLFVSLLWAGRAAEREALGLDRAWALGLSALVLGAMAASSVATWFEIFPNDLYLWLTLSVVVTMNRSPAQRPALS